MSDEKKGGMTVAEAGRLGGAKGGATTKKRYGHDFYVAIGKKGGQTVRDRHKGTDFYEKIGKKGGNRVRELLNAGKAAEAAAAKKKSTPETEE